MMGESSVDRNSGAVRVFFAVTSEPVINDRRSQPETKIDLAKLASKQSQILLVEKPYVTFFIISRIESEWK